MLYRFYNQIKTWVLIISLYSSIKCGTAFSQENNHNWVAEIWQRIHFSTWFWRIPYCCHPAVWCWNTPL